MAQNQPTTQPKNHNHVLIGVIVILALAAVIGITVLFGNRQVDEVEDRKQSTDDMSVLLNAITRYQINNNGKFPTDTAKLKSDYIRGSFPYTISITNLSEGEIEKLPATSSTMYVIKNATCTDSSQAEYNSLSRRFVIMYHPAGSASAICLE